MTRTRSGSAFEMKQLWAGTAIQSRSFWFLLVSAITILGVCAPLRDGHAKPAGPGSELERDGDRLADQGDFDLAHKAYLAAYLLEPKNAKRVYGAARMAHRVGKWHDAVNAYLQYLASASAGDSLALRAREFLAELAQSHGTPELQGSSVGRSGLTWVRFLGGRFVLGDPHLGHTPKDFLLAPFWLAKTETTVQQYEACVRDGPCTAPDEVHDDAEEEPGNHSSASEFNWGASKRSQFPINGVSHRQAQTFCQWAGGRLPSAEEWQYAARSGGRGQAFPWGNELPNCQRAVITTPTGWGCGRLQSATVCSKPKGNNDYGVCDLAGNLAEWVAAAVPRPATVACGGSYGGVDQWDTEATITPEKMSQYRAASCVPVADQASTELGFRCAKDDPLAAMRAPSIANPKSQPEVTPDPAPAPDPPPPKPPQLGRMYIKSVPSGAMVHIDGRSEGPTPLTSRPLDVGQHTVDVTMDGYFPDARSVAVAAGATSEQFIVLTKRFGRLRVVAFDHEQNSLDGLSVLLDGGLVGTTPWEDNVPAGSYRVAIGHQLRSADVDVDTTTLLRFGPPSPFEVQRQGALKPPAAKPGARSLTAVVVGRCGADQHVELDAGLDSGIAKDSYWTPDGRRWFGFTDIGFERACTDYRGLGLKLDSKVLAFATDEAKSPWAYHAHLLHGLAILGALPGQSQHMLYFAPVGFEYGHWFRMYAQLGSQFVQGASNVGAWSAVRSFDTVGGIGLQKEWPHFAAYLDGMVGYQISPFRLCRSGYVRDCPSLMVASEGPTYGARAGLQVAIFSVHTTVMRGPDVGWALYAGSGIEW